MPDLEQTARDLALRVRSRPAPAARFLPLEPPHGDTPIQASLEALSEAPPGAPSEAPPEAPRPAPCVAVDGSHAVLFDNGSLWVVAVRAEAVQWPDPAPLEAETEAQAASPSEAQELLDRLHQGWGLEAPRARSAEAFAEGLRALREAQAAVQAIAAMAPGGLLLLDGALADLPPGPQAMADRIRAAAGRAGVAAVGVAKRSALSEDGVALTVAWQRGGPPGTWCVEVRPGILVARLHAQAQHAFRVDASPAQAARLLPYCRDAVYTGYPYPLAVAHNRVALTAGHVQELKARLAAQVRAAGGAEAAAALLDFHEVLDRSVPG